MRIYFVGRTIGLAMVALVMGGAAFGQPVEGTDVLYTTSGDFQAGDAVQVNYWFGEGQIDLNRDYSSKPDHPFIWIPLRAWGAVALMATQDCVDTNPECPINLSEGQILGVYNTDPEFMQDSPARTAVDSMGNLWVANGGEPHLYWSVEQKGSITKILNPYVVQSGPNTGDLTNGDGCGPNTSRGLNDIRPWPNPVGDPSVDYAEDDCIVMYERTRSRQIQALAIESTPGGEFLWVAGTAEVEGGGWIVEKYDVESGDKLDEVSHACGGAHQGLFANGVLWMSSPGNKILRLDTRVSSSPECIAFDRHTYGLAVDEEGYIWVANFEWNTVTKMTPDGLSRTFHVTSWPNWDLGVAATSGGDVWVTDSFSNYVSRMDLDGNVLRYYLLMERPNGVAEAANGTIWVLSSYYSVVHRINPYDHSVAHYPFGGYYYPISLGGMTNSVVRSAPVETGSWTVVQDSGVGGQSWGRITWNTELGNIEFGASSPGGIGVEVRASDVFEDLGTVTPIDVENGQAFSTTGRFLEVSVHLWSVDGQAPVVTDIRVETLPDADGDGYLPPSDCDDHDPSIHPGAAEILCDDVDQNCNGMDDEDVNLDGDPVSYCAGDCDDNDSSNYPGNTEVCDGRDNNCNAASDEGTADADADGICDAIDNCPVDPNPGQEDCDGDSTGDVCDEDDTDGDGLTDAQEISFASGVCPGSCPDPVDSDSDDDGLLDGFESNADPDRNCDFCSADTDGDGIGDSSDSFCNDPMLTGDCALDLASFEAYILSLQTSVFQAPGANTEQQRKQTRAYLASIIGKAAKQHCKTANAANELQKARERVDGAEPPLDDMVAGTAEKALVLDTIEDFLYLFTTGACSC